MKTDKMRASAVALSVLRWLVGWHFLYEGVWKLMQQKGWSCLSYIDNAQGPLAGLFKWMAAQGWLVAIGDLPTRTRPWHG